MEDGIRAGPHPRPFWFGSCLLRPFFCHGCPHLPATAGHGRPHLLAGDCPASFIHYVSVPIYVDVCSVCLLCVLKRLMSVSTVACVATCKPIDDQLLPVSCSVFPWRPCPASPRSFFPSFCLPACLADRVLCANVHVVSVV